MENSNCTYNLETKENLEKCLELLGNEDIESRESEVPPLEDVSEVLERININKKNNEELLSSKKLEKNINKPKCQSIEKEDSKSKLPNSKDFGGLKKGFLFGNNTKRKYVKPKQGVAKVNKDEEIPFIKATPANSGLLFKEVQEAMDKENPMKEIQNNFTSKIESYPKVTEVLSDPAWLGILDEFQKDPEKAMIKYQHNEDVKKTMKELCSILGDSFLHMTPSQKSDEELICQQLMEDPKLKEVLLDPFVERVMDWMKEGHNDRVQESLRKATPAQKAKIQMLIDYGLFSYVS